MALYVAVCDDNIADRKQTERLLSRESDARIHNTGVLYIDSFGSREALFTSPIHYDLFFIDQSASIKDSIVVADDLRALGVSSPIVLCSSTPDFLEQEIAGKDYTCLSKPIKKEVLSHIIDEAIQIREHRVPRIELREKRTTYYVTNDEILYAKESEGFLAITLTNNRIPHVLGNIYEFFMMVDDSPNFLQVNKNTAINLDHVVAVERRAFTMTDQELISYSFFDQNRIQQYYDNYRRNK